MLKTALIIFLALFFIFNGVNHFINPLILEEYMHKRQIKYGPLLVKLSGFLLIVCGVGLLFPSSFVKISSSVALAVFVLLAAFLVHAFWKEEDKSLRLLETQNFIKNFVIFFEMLYLASTFK